MGIQNKPTVTKINGNDKIWSHSFNLFEAEVYYPATTLPGDIINFGFSAPYFIVFTDYKYSEDQILQYSEKTGLKDIASAFETSIVFITPANKGGWEAAPEGIFEELIENSKIHQYHEDGIAILNNRFFHKNEGFAIRGAIFRTCLIGKGAAADYIASHLLKKINGAGLWGPADIAPTACILENLSVMPKIERRDMPIVSIGNSAEINDYIISHTDFNLIQKNPDFKSAYYDFIRQFKRWGWVGDLQQEPDFEKLGMAEEFGVAEVKTSKDNSGDDAGTALHKIGYLAYYNKNLFDNSPVPLLLCFHGGGDSAKHISQVSEWYKVAHDHNFLLICVENHINSTASEMMQLLEILKAKYKIDNSRIYASGFSMGGCKTWDLYQEYPDVFAGLAPMDATFDVGLNLYGQPSVGLHGTGKINQDIMVPIFYSAGEETPLPELPFQEEKCLNRMAYVFSVNKCKTTYDVRFDQQQNWKNKLWGIDGDSISKFEDKSRNATLTINYFASQDNVVYTAFSSVSGQGHECRYHTCEHAWNFISQFIRDKSGKIIKE